MSARKNGGALALFAAVMAVFGTVGWLRRWIPLPSGTLAMLRGAIGAVFLLIIVFARKKKPDFAAVHKKLPLLLLSGAMIGANWILLFEAYTYTTVAAATLCYYMEPALLILVSPLFFKERLTPRKLFCVVLSVLGMGLVSGVLQTGLFWRTQLRGLGCGLGAAALYTGVVVLNKKLGKIPHYEKTTVQLAAAAVVLLPYVLLVEKPALSAFGWQALLLLLLMGILHTGLAYAAYFGALSRMSAQSAALWSYIDPITALLISAFVLREAVSVWTWVGAALILGAAVLGELPEKKKRRKSAR